MDGHDGGTEEGSANMTVNNLYRELLTIPKPVQFGTLLGIPQATLDTIATDKHLNLDGQRMDICRYIAENYRVQHITWASIASTLDILEQGNLAHKIRTKYAVASNNPDNTRGEHREPSEPREDKVSTNTGKVAPQNALWRTFAVLQSPRCEVVLAVLVVVIGVATWSFQGQSNSNQSPSEDRIRNTQTQHEITNIHELYRSVDSIPGDWESVCVNLRVPEGVLSLLQSSDSSGVSKMRSCLRTYYDSGEAVWEEVVLAVAEAPIYNRKLAKKIAGDHGIDYESLLSSEDIH